jgi:hypothetical protein
MITDTDLKLQYYKDKYVNHGDLSASPENIINFSINNFNATGGPLWGNQP